MRPFIFLIIGFLLFAVVFTVVIFLPQSTNQSVTVTKIDLNRQPLPVVQSDPGGNYILEFFPEPSDAIQNPMPANTLTGVQPNVVPNQMQEPSTQTDPNEIQKELDKNRMLALIHDWVYTDFIAVGTTKQGTINKSRDNLSFSVFEGETLENGINIASLNNDSALLALGEAEFYLRRAAPPTFYEEVKRTLRPLTPQEQEQAYDYYMRVYGDKFKEMSKNYVPSNGMPPPRKVSEEEQRQGLEQYWQQYGKNFKQESANFKPQLYYNQNLRDAYEKYWKQFGNGDSKPNFDEIFASPNSVGPDARIVPAEQLQSGQ